MKLVTTKFKSGGLHEWQLVSITQTEGRSEVLSRSHLDTNDEDIVVDNSRSRNCSNSAVTVTTLLRGSVRK